MNTTIVTTTVAKPARSGSRQIKMKKKKKLRRPKRFVCTINTSLHSHTSLFHHHAQHVCTGRTDSLPKEERKRRREIRVQDSMEGARSKGGHVGARGQLECPGLLEAFWDSRRKLLDGGLKKCSDSSSRSSEGDVQVPGSCA